MIAFEGLLQGSKDLPLVLRLAHIDEIYNYYSADIAQAQLPSYGLGCLQVSLKDGLIYIAMTDKTASIDIDNGHGLGLIDDQMATRLKIYPAGQGPLYLVLHSIQVEYRPLARVYFNPIDRVRQQVSTKLQQALAAFARVNPHPLQLPVRQITHGAQIEGQIFVD
jgi:hypothetical protein